MQTSMHFQSMFNCLCVLAFYQSLKVVRAQSAQDPIQLKLTPAVLNPVVVYDPAAVFPASTTAATSPYAVASPYDPFISGNSVAKDEKTEGSIKELTIDKGLSLGAIIGIIFGVAVFLICSILFYRWANKSKTKKAETEENPLFARIKEISKSKDSIKKSISARSQPSQPMQQSAPPLRMQDQRPINAPKRPVETQQELKKVGLAQPPLYPEEHAILDSMDLPILPANLSASERVRMIIDTLRKSRGPKSRPTTPMAPEKPIMTRKSSNKIETPDIATKAPSIPSVPIPPGYRPPERNLPDGYRPIKPHTRPNQKNSALYERPPMIQRDIINLESPFKEEIDGKVSGMIETVLNHEKSKK